METSIQKCWNWLKTSLLIRTMNVKCWMILFNEINDLRGNNIVCSNFLSSFSKHGIHLKKRLVKHIFFGEQFHGNYRPRYMRGFTVLKLLINLALRDMNEAIIRCFGDNSAIKSKKSMTCHLLGVVRDVEAVATIIVNYMAIQTGWLHPNINLENPDVGLLIEVPVVILIYNFFWKNKNRSSNFGKKAKENDQEQGV